MNKEELTAVTLALLATPIAAWKTPESALLERSSWWNPSGPVDGKAKSGERCGDGNGVSCEDGLCCSGWGFCGKDPAHCAVPSCQYQYGACETNELPKGDEYEESNKNAWVKTTSTPKNVKTRPSPKPSVDVVELFPEEDQDLQALKIEPHDNTWSNIIDDEDFSWEEEIREQPDWEAESMSQYARDGDREKFGNVPYGVEIRECSRSGVVALTFDDGPSPTLTGQLLDLLEDRGVKATFFVNGDNRGKITEEGKSKHIMRMIEEKHQVASHGWSHLNMNDIDEQTKRSEITNLENALSGLMGGIPTYFRPPFGSCDDACLALMDEYGYHVIRWDLDTNDWKQDLQYSKNTVEDAFSSMDSANVLSHDIHELTVESLAEYMIDAAEREGKELVTIGECMDDPSENWYRNPFTGGKWRPSQSLQFAQHMRDGGSPTGSLPLSIVSPTSFAAATTSSAAERCGVNMKKDECRGSNEDVEATGTVSEDDEDDESAASTVGRWGCILVSLLTMSSLFLF